jgi:hypothetical protein
MDCCDDAGCRNWYVIIVPGVGQVKYLTIFSPKGFYEWFLDAREMGLGRDG